MSHQTKHLSLVESTVTDAYCKLESTYGAAKGKALNYTPDFVAKVVAQVESICQPMVSFGQKGASNVLLYADSTVDSGLHLASSTCMMSRNTAVKLVGEERVKPVEGILQQAREAVVSGYDTVQSKGVYSAMQLAYEQSTVYAKAFVGSLYSSVNNSAASVVDKYVKPSSQYAQAQYNSFHATVVKQPLYASLYSFTTSLGTFLYMLPPVKLPLTFAKNRVYPHFEPTLKPYLDSAVQYLTAFENHIQPRVDPPANARPDVVAKKSKNSVNKASKQAKTITHQDGDTVPARPPPSE